MKEKCTKFEALFTFSNDEELKKHIEECEECKKEMETLNKCSCTVRKQATENKR